MKPICVPCRRFYRPTKSGYYFIEGMPSTSDALPGTAAPEQWRPYKLWCGDLWTCEGCGAQAVVGAGRGPVAEHYQPDFDEKCARLGADQLQVNDC
jgi:hypothetical protein